MSVTVGVAAAGSKAVAEASEALGKAPQGELVEVATTAPLAVTPVQTGAAPGNRTITFVRNILPNETIKLRDGTPIKFERYLFTTSDEVIIKKIAAEMAGNHIFPREGETL